MLVLKAEELKKHKTSKSLNQQRQLINHALKDLYTFNTHTENQRHKEANAEQAVLLGSERMGPLSSNPSTVECFPLHYLHFNNCSPLGTVSKQVILSISLLICPAC